MHSHWVPSANCLGTNCVQPVDSWRVSWALPRNLVAALHRVWQEWVQTPVLAHSLSPILAHPYPQPVALDQICLPGVYPLYPQSLYSKATKNIKGDI